MQKSIFLLLAVGLLLLSCSESIKKVTVKNNLDLDRENETVEVLMSQLGIDDVEIFNKMGVVDAETNQVLISQQLDSNGDGKNDILLFQVQVKANSQKTYKILPAKGEAAESKVYSRFVPERTDDYAWENDRVAFRTYGPLAQKMNEEGDPAGTLSSGLDCWLKKVDYPIINKWYEKYTSGAGTYHEDTGEGFDPYHVGGSRGCGGIGVFIDDELYVSKNFTSYQTLENGPIRTRFTLDYEDWKAGAKLVQEQKQISLDLGNNLMHIVDNLEGVEEATVGITLHKNEGLTNIDTLNCSFSYWEPMKGSELGTGVVIDPKYFLGVTKVISVEPDKSQLLIHLKVLDGKIEYYTGFGWKGSEQFQNQTEWCNYLQDFANKLTHPLIVKVN